MTKDEWKELLAREPFVPLRVRLSSGEKFDIHDPQSVALMKHQLFVALPDGEHWAFIRFLHVASVQSITNGHSGGSRRKKSGR